MNQVEKVNFIKTLEDREKILEDSEKAMIGLILKNIEHKRAFLGTLMTISAAIIAGLFILTTNQSYDNDLNLLVILNISFFAIFIIGSSIYLTAILSQESLSLDKHLQFIRQSKSDFVEKVGTEIIDIDSYEKYREKKYKEGKESELKIRGSHEIWFISINALFIFSCSLLLVSFLLVSICNIQ